MLEQRLDQLKKESAQATAKMAIVCGGILLVMCAAGFVATRIAKKRKQVKYEYVLNPSGQNYVLITFPF